MTIAQDKQDAKDEKAAAAKAAARAPLNVGDPVTAKGKEGAVTEVVKGADGSIKSYRVSVESDEPRAAGVPVKIEVKTFAVADVKELVKPEDADEKVEQFKAGDLVIAKGGEKGAVTEVLTQDTDPRFSTYLAQFGKTLGLITISGANLVKAPVVK